MIKGYIIKNAREKREMLQADLAAECGCERKVICRLENGKSINLDSFMRACQLLEINPMDVWRFDAKKAKLI